MHNGNKNIWILFFTLVVVMLGFGMIIPILPFYVKHFGAKGSVLGLLMATYSLMQFIFAPFWGSLSDRIGRKPVLIIGVLGNAISQLLFGFATQLWMLFAARILAGILSSATLPTAMAYISDSSTREDRSGKMGLIGAAMGIGMVLGPGLGGVLAKQNLSLPFFIAGGLSLASMVLIYIFLPEPVKHVHLESRQLQKGSRFQVLWWALIGPIGLLFFLAFLFNFGMTNFESIFGLYASDRYDYGPEQVGGILAIIGLLSALVQGGLTGPLVKRFGEVKVIQAALIASSIGFVSMTQANTFSHVLITSGFFISSTSLLSPVTSALLSKRTVEAQGITMGLANSFQSLGRILGPTYAGAMYDIQMNLPYLSGSAIFFLGFLICILFLKSQPDQSLVVKETLPHP